MAKRNMPKPIFGNKGLHWQHTLKILNIRAKNVKFNIPQHMWAKRKILTNKWGVHYAYKLSNGQIIKM